MFYSKVWKHREKKNPKIFATGIEYSKMLNWSKLYKVYLSTFKIFFVDFIIANVLVKLYSAWYLYKMVAQNIVHARVEWFVLFELLKAYVYIIHTIFKFKIKAVVYIDTVFKLKTIL